jgi:hypothetical protein
VSAHELAEEHAFARCALEIGLLVADVRFYAAWQRPGDLWDVIGRISRLVHSGAHPADVRALAGRAYAEARR